MVYIEISEATRRALSPVSRRFQAAVAVLANRKLGVEAKPTGIYKYEGDVMVHGCEIAIKPGYVIDDFKKVRGHEPTAEEAATAAALREAISVWEGEGVAGLERLAGDWTAMDGDPLRALLGEPD